MVADRVEVTSRKAGGEQAWTWASDGRGAFTIAPAERETAGTDVLLHLKSDAQEFLDPVRLEEIVRRWADHITVPVTIHRDGKDLPANEGTALWRKPKSEVSEQSYNEFYRHLGHLFDKPWATLHWRAEGMLDYTALLFIPGSRPFDLLQNERQSRLRLHIKRMFITDEAELLPPWLRFVQGVVDTEDLPLNVSREMLQTTPVLARIRKALIGRLLGELRTRGKDAEDYAKFWENFGAVLKEGMWEDDEYRTELASLGRFRSSNEAGWVSLGDYVARMKPNQDTVYYLAGDDVEALRHSPQLEGVRARGFEVLLLSDPVDSFWPDRLGDFEGKKLASVTRASIELPEREDSQPVGDLAPLLKAIKSALGDAISEVRRSHRLVDSAVVLAAPSAGPDLQVQRLLRRSGRAMPAPPPAIEINPRHTVIRALAEAATGGADVADQARLLLDLARVQDGEPPQDPAWFANKVTDLMRQTTRSPAGSSPPPPS
jgi:molecular chaperone HtpG